MRIALTGVPGVGKSTATKILRKRGYKAVDLNAFAEEHRLIKGYDRARDCKIIDLKKLDYLINREFSCENIFLVSHFAHLLNNDLIIVLRCSPKELKKRLVKKRYDNKKLWRI
ncbi:MAG: AAA family ATPase [Candidatus Thermoplasmatota archaeon]